MTPPTAREKPASLLDALTTDQLATPAPADAEQPGQAQSLGKGAAGVSLLHIERALAGLGTWATAHAWVRAATRCEISAAENAGLYVGAPAISFILHAAEADEIPRYGRALTRLDAHVASLAHRRVDAALARIDRSEMPAFAEYDLFYGLTGIGQLLLRRAPGSDALGRILGHLVRLTEPLRIDGTWLPGWWASHDPDPLLPTPGGHANFGIAHGITGPLALLAHAMRRGIIAEGHLGAISEICAHLDAWRQDCESGPWWPQWITRDELRTGRVKQTSPLRPSWCYGTPGIARAQQIAAIATGDTSRQMMAEHALASCLSDPAQLRWITDTGLCHGWSGLYQTAWRAARDALTPTISTRLPHLVELLTRHAEASEHHNAGLLDGTAGLVLALQTAGRSTPPISGWDSCLLIN
ncbi:MAG: lanthionine synthetase C family protein [Pseudonocardiaceae bacterium]